MTRLRGELFSFFIDNARTGSDNKLITKFERARAHRSRNRPVTPVGNSYTSYRSLGTVTPSSSVALAATLTHTHTHRTRARAPARRKCPRSTAENTHTYTYNSLIFGGATYMVKSCYIVDYPERTTVPLRPYTRQFCKTNFVQNFFFFFAKCIQIR